MNEQAIKGIADADTSHLGIRDDAPALLKVAVFVEISMHDARPRLDDGHASIVANEVDEFPSASGNAEVHIADSTEQFRRGFVGGRQQRQRIHTNA